MNLSGVLIRKNPESSYYEVWGRNYSGLHTLFTRQKAVEIGRLVRAEGYKVWAPQEVLSEIDKAS